MPGKFRELAETLVSQAMVTENLKLDMDSVSDRENAEGEIDKVGHKHHSVGSIIHVQIPHPSMTSSSLRSHLQSKNIKFSVANSGGGSSSKRHGPPYGPLVDLD